MTHPERQEIVFKAVYFSHQWEERSPGEWYCEQCSAWLRGHLADVPCEAPKKKIDGNEQEGKAASPGLAVVHKDWGVFLGVALGGAFWSAVESVGQSEAPTMVGEEMLAEFLVRFCPKEPRENFKLCPIPGVKAGDYASMSQCVLFANVDPWEIPPEKS